jgi:hypothetical protein
MAWAEAASAICFGAREWSLSIKYNHQINKEKDPNATDTQT